MAWSPRTKAVNSRTKCLRHHGRLLQSIDRGKCWPRPIERDHWLSEGGVRFETVAYCCRIVILSRDELAAAVRAWFGMRLMRIVSGRDGDGLRDAARRTDASSAETPDNLLMGNVNQNDNERRRRRHRVEGLGLNHRARKAVENEASRGIRSRDPLADQICHQVITDQPAARHNRSHLLAECGTVTDCRAENVAG
jgi:hypothetical protein